MLSRRSCACAISGFVLIATSGGWVARGDEHLEAPLAQAGTPDDAVAVEWTYRASGGSPGAAGLQLADLAGDGRRHLVATSSYFGGYWYILQYRAGDYVLEWASEPVDQFPAEISALQTANIDADPADELLLASGTNIRIYQGFPPVLDRTISVPSAGIRSLNVADLDGNGDLELVFRADATGYGQGTLYVLDLSTGAVEYAGPGLGGRALAVGNVDDDPALEIVSAGGAGQPGYVVDGQSHAVEWTNPTGFGDVVRLGDLDRDGRMEAVGWSSDIIRIWDVERRLLAGSITGVQVDALRLADIEGDGALEIVYGHAQIKVVNGQDLTLKWQVENPGAGITDIAIGNSDDDPSLELAWGAGGKTRDPDLLHVMDAGTHVIDWHSNPTSGPFALSSGDVDQDGATEILSGGTLPIYAVSRGAWSVHEGATHRLEFFGEAPANIGRIRSANVDADPALEVFITVEGYDQVLVCYDGLTHLEQWRSPSLDDSTYGRVVFELADVDDDGRLEAVVANAHYVFVFDAATGTLEWQSPSVPSVAPLLRIANIDGDTQPEILLSDSASKALYVFDAVRRTTQGMVVPAFTAFEAVDVDGDGRAELIFGDVQGSLRMTGPDGSPLALLAPPGMSAVKAIVARDLDGRPGFELAVDHENEVSLHAADGSLLWRSDPLTSFPYLTRPVDHLHVADVDGDGRVEMLVNLGYGFRVYEIRTLPSAAISVNDVVVAEGDGAGGMVTFTVSLSAPAAVPVKVNYQTVAGTADAGSDFVAAAGTLTFDPGVTSRTVAVAIVGDRILENDETFELRLSAAEYARLGNARGIATITNDDPPGLRVSGVLAREPEAGDATASFTIRLTPAWGSVITVDYATADLTATAPGDYESASGHLTFSPWETEKRVDVVIHQDDLRESAETFSLGLSNPVGAVVLTGPALGRIVDWDRSYFHTLPPCRLIDTRSSASPLSAGGEVTVELVDRCGVPPGVRAVALNVTVTEPTATGHVTVAGKGVPPSGTSTVNFSAGRTRGNNAITAVGESGALTVAFASSAPTATVHVILDVSGYFQ